MPGRLVARTVPGMSALPAPDSVTEAARDEAREHIRDHALKEAPRTERLSRELDRMAEVGLRFEEETAAKIGKAEARAARWGRVALWLIALTLVWIAWKVA